MAFGDIRDSDCNPGQYGDYNGTNLRAKGNIGKLRRIVAFKLVSTGGEAGEL